jgi:PAS domain-containing protein
MNQKSTELILFRQLATYLNTPIAIVDRQGNLVFFNEAAEQILGLQFAESGELTSKEWGTIFSPQDGEGAQIPAEKLGLTIAFAELRPAYQKLYLKGLHTKTVKHIEAFSMPIINQLDQVLGAIVFFPETKP